MHCVNATGTVQSVGVVVLGEGLQAHDLCEMLDSQKSCVGFAAMRDCVGIYCERHVSKTRNDL
jgi:hypothetical protein